MKKAAWIGSTLAATMLLGTAIVGCGTTGADSGSTGGGSTEKSKAQVLNWTLADDVPQLDPEQATDEISFEVLNDAMEGLMRIGPNGQPQPGIAKSVDTSTDGMTYTFHLRSDAKWSNGDPVTAQDFVYGWERLLNPKLGAGYAYIMTMIQGADDYNSGKLKDFSQVGVKALDANTLQVKLRFPTPYFLDLAAYIPFFPANQKFVEKIGSKYGTTPDNLLYDGPFSVTSWKHDDSLVMKKNSTYWDKDHVKLDQINFRIVKDTALGVNLYDTGKEDVAGLSAKYVPAYNTKPGYGTIVMDSIFYLEFNQKANKAFASPKVRRAISLAVDRAQLTKVALNNGSIPALGLIPPSIPGDPNQSGDFRTQNGKLISDNNSTEAKQLLQDGLKDLGITSVPKFSIMVDDSDIGKNEATILQQAWQQNLGINVEIDAVPFKTRVDKQRKKDYQMVFAGWGADYNDPMTFLDMWQTGNPNNDVGYSNKQYDSDVKAAYAEADKSKRMQDLLAAEKLFMQDMPVAPIYFQGRAYVQRPTVHDVYRFPSGSQPDFKWAYIK